MKTGRTLQDLAAEIKRQAETKRDFVLSTENMSVAELDGELRLIFGDQRLEIGDTAHDQIASVAGVPKAYYDRMKKEEPWLLSENVNTWFHRRPQGRMVRALDGRARALLSDKYRPLDNYELAEAALPALLEAKLDIVSCEMTESRLYLKAVDRSVQRFIPSGHRMGDGSHVGFKVPSGEVVPAIQISNSEIGYGSLQVVGGYLDKGCTNLMWMMKQAGMRKYHIGAQHDLGEELYRVLTDETRVATDKALWLQFRDTVKAALDPKVFDERVATLADAAQQPITGDVAKVVEVTARKFLLSEGQRVSVLSHLIRGGDLSQFGLANAVTSAANDQDDYDQASGLEALGGKIIELPRHEWRELAKAA